MSERLAALALQNIPGIGPTYAKRLVEQAGSLKAVFEAGADLSESSNIPAAYLDTIRSRRRAAFELAGQQLEAARKLGQTVVALTEDGYPARLKEIPDPPVALYIYGEALPTDALSLGVVGTRKATPGGVKFAREIGLELASAGITVVSGLALGIDAAAHSGAMDAEGGRTWAVLGTGADVCYPARNQKIYDRLLKDERGVIVSEYPPGTQPVPYHFPIRNRVISGLTLGVIVVEAPERSGALITARLAVEQGREVFAVPQPARSVFGAGANRLIQEGAHLVERVEDILSVIEPEVRRMVGRRLRRQTPDEPVAVAGPASAIYELLKGGVTGLDDLVDQSRLAVPAVLSELTRLEIVGRIRRTSAGTFEAVKRTA